ELHYRRFVVYAEKRRDVETHVVRQSPGNSWSNNKTVVRRASAELIAKAAELTFDSGFQFFKESRSSSHWPNVFSLRTFVIISPSWSAFVKEVNRGNETLGDAPLTTTIAFDLLLKEGIKGPFDFVEKVFGEKQSEFVGVGNFLAFIETARPELVRGSRRTFIMQNVADAKFVFGEDRRIERNFVPVSKGIACFDAECRVLKIS